MSNSPKKKMLITTTNNIEGATIEAYIKPVSSHVVFGANLFSDIAASFSDIFGGRSASYQKQLVRLTEAAISELAAAAKAVKANAIVGMHLDYSEISGGGKAGMFMAVATGTAVRLGNHSESGSGVEFNRLLDHDFVDRSCFCATRANKAL